MLKITVYDDFFHQSYTGTFETEEECREFYAQEHGQFPEDINIVNVVTIESERGVAT